MKFYCLFFICIPFTGISQRSNSDARVIYLFSHVRDTTQPNVRYSEQMMIDFNNDASVYRSYSLYYMDSAESARIKHGSQIPSEELAAMF